LTSEQVDVMALMIARIAGVVVTIAGIAMIRREREDAEDLDRSPRPQVVAAWVVVTVLGAAISVWAIMAG
jgi:heme/copper-type cytochrome/quinol oxidase subunit 2